MEDKTVEELTHFNSQGRVRMVDVSEKPAARREARAYARVRVSRETLALIASGGMKKGDVLAAAQLAGVMGAKRTADLIPLCHPVALSGADLEFSLDQEVPAVEIISTVRCTGPTGVEMEALSAVSAAALTVYDMCKAVQRDIVIEKICLLHKSGGRSGDFDREDGPVESPPVSPEEKTGGNLYTAAALTVSDKGFQGLRRDASGPAVVRLLEADGWKVVHTEILPDEREAIQSALVRCADEMDVNLIVTTGGTGFSPRDVTPEATRAVIERETPGIPEAMRAESMRVTPRGCLSREAAGIRGGTLIVNVPGSEKAARECLGTALPALRHGVDILRGRDGECGGNRHG